ncbi:CoA-transferase [Streptomyces sp. NPDC004690]
MHSPRDIVTEPARALDGLADGSVVALGGPPVPESLLDRLQRSGPCGVHLLCTRTALDSPLVQHLVRAGRVSRCTVAVPSPAEGDLQLAIPAEWLTVDEMTEGLRAGAAGVDDFYSPGEVHTAVRTPSHDQERDKPRRLRVGSVPFAHKASLHCDVALLYADEADLMGNLAMDGAYSALFTAMAHAAARTIAECAHVRADGPLGRARTAVTADHVQAVVPAARRHRAHRWIGGRAPSPEAGS